MPDDLVERILDAGRLTGSAKNRQPWRFLVVESADRRERLADAVYEPANVRGAVLVVALVGKGFDLGRAAQNMMLAAWSEGVTSTPNGIAEPAAAAGALGLSEGEAAYVITFGYPASGRLASARSAPQWSARANRKPIAEVVQRL